MDLHPQVGVVRLAGQFWPLANSEAAPKIEAIRSDHQDCPNCISHQITRMIGLHVVTAAIKLPGERDYRPIALDDYLVAAAEPVVAHGATVANHLNAAHGSQLRALAGRLLGQPESDIAGASVGAVDRHGFELSAVSGLGGRLITVGFRHRPPNERELQQCFRAALSDGSPDGGTPCL